MSLCSVPDPEVLAAPHIDIVMTCAATANACSTLGWGVDTSLLLSMFAASEVFRAPDCGRVVAAALDLVYFLAPVRLPHRRSCMDQEFKFHFGRSSITRKDT